MSLEAYEARLSVAEGDHAALSELADELRTVSAPWAGRLRFQVIARRAKLKPVSRDVPVHSNPLAELGLPLPTKPGTPLYRIRLTDQSFMTLEADLKAAGARLASNPNRFESAKFVVWASEWFRRKFDGGIQRWADLGAPIGLKLDHFSGRRLCKNGFEYWQLPLLHLDYSTEYLASIARQAGFPVAALDGGVGGWAQRYLLFIVGRMLGNRQDSFDDAIAHAIDGEGDVPQTWRGEELRVVCAELATAVVGLRQFAETSGVASGLLVSRWLDENLPDWRDELPISVDANSAGFIDGLMAAKPLKGGGGSVRVSRELRFIDGARSEYVALHLNGSLKQIDEWGGGSALSEEFSRLRLFAAGQLSDRLPGNLAIAEPEENGDWSARAAIAIDAVAWPLAAPVECELRGNDRRVGNIFCIPSGAPVGGGLRVWIAADGDASELPQRMQLAGTGSGGFRSDTLWLDIPENWLISVSEGGAAPVLCHDDGARRIWRVVSSTNVTTDQGDIFTVRPGQKSETKDQIRLLGEAAEGLSSAVPQTPLFLGWPQIFVSDRGRDRVGQRTEIWWRPEGQKQWRQLGIGEPFGATEFAWRDAVSGHLRAKSEAYILPGTFRLQLERSANRIFVEDNDWGGSISVIGYHKNKEDRWVIPIDRPNTASADIRIDYPNSPSFTAKFAIPIRAWIGKWAGGMCEKDSQIGMAELHHHLARTGHATDLMGDLLDRSGKQLPQGQAEWEINGELGLATLRDEISALIAPAGIDAKLKLNFNDGHENYWFVSQFSNELVREIGYGLIPKNAVVEQDIRVSGRFLGKADSVKDFGPYGGHTGTGQRIELPVLFGPWLIYLTNDGTTLTRPYLLKGKELAVTPAGVLGKIMVEETAVRMPALEGMVSDCAENPQSLESQGILRAIVELAASLNDLPPSTFEVFPLMASRPGLMIDLIFACQSAHEVEMVLALEKGLSFSWVCAPVQIWRENLERLGGALFDAFMQVQKSPDLAITSVREATAKFVQPIIDFEPALAAHFTPGLRCDAISHVIENFLERSSDRIGKEKLQNPFRPAHDGILQDWHGATHYRRAIDAPIVAAHAAKHDVLITHGQIACIKEIARRHPRYFAECYAASLQE